MTDCDEIHPGEADTWHVVSMRHLSDNQIHQLLKWLDDQPGGRFYWTLSRNFWFERSEDLAMCVLSWK